MDINDYEELSNFAYNQCDTMTDSLGLPTAPKKVIRFLENKLIIYLRLYDKPLYKKAKRDLIINHILDIYPPSIFWKIFHPRLNRLVEQEKKKREEWEQLTKNENQHFSSITPSAVGVPAVIEPQEIIISKVENNEDFDNDFDCDCE